MKKKLICSAVCCFLPTFALAEAFFTPKQQRDATFSVVRDAITYPFTITPTADLTGGHQASSKLIATAVLGNQAVITSGVKLGVRWDTSQSSGITVDSTDMKIGTIPMNGDSTKTIKVEFDATMATIRTDGQDTYYVDNRMAPITPYEVRLKTTRDVNYIYPGTYVLRIQSAVYNQ